LKGQHSASFTYTIHNTKPNYYKNQTPNQTKTLNIYQTLSGQVPLTISSRRHWSRRMKVVFGGLQ